MSDRWISFFAGVIGVILGQILMALVEYWMLH